ncbi:MAG: DUF6398 domain-containing protein [Deltaproteobacteria bacterium]
MEKYTRAEYNPANLVPARVPERFADADLKWIGTKMLLPHADLLLFFKLNAALMRFVNQRLKVVPGDFLGADAYAALPPEARLKVREAFLKEPDLLEAFIEQNPADLSGEELAIIGSWRHRVSGRFYVFRALRKHTVFLSAGEEPVAFGVTSLSQPVTFLVPSLPAMTDALLLPFKDKIIYDGLLNSYRIFFGPGIRRSLNESCREAKARRGIVTSLPIPAEPASATAGAAGSREAPVPRLQPAARRSRAPADDRLKSVASVVVEMIEQFCREHLNDEYAALCRKLAEKLARKRPSPLASGNPRTWSCAIVRTIGWVNFLGDKSQTPCLHPSDIDAGFGVSESTGAAKSMAIRKLLKIQRFDPAWTLPSRLDDNPFGWMRGMNSFLFNIRNAR